ncbi:MAG: BMC domain-containing protein [Planctomycetota bacterium]
MGVDLRAEVLLDRLQAQLASYVASTAKGYLPVAGQASLWVEIAPGIEINRLTDVALKGTQVRPAVQVVERAYGLLEVHSDSQAEVQEASRRILAHLGLRREDRMVPKIQASQIISHIDPHQAMLINRNRSGSMILGGQTLYILEVFPAAYAVLAANEAEKASPVTLVEVRPFGAFGRLYMAGDDSSIQSAARAAESALANVAGRSAHE